MAATRTCEILSDEQKRVLNSFYENGMNSASKEMENMIQKAAEEAETTFEKVKVKYSCFTHCLGIFGINIYLFSNNCYMIC